ncbi:MAG: ComEA family DNA-binding protein [Lachnospiraceae bacterium]|nr:ComEA family DNA-binding protein [Lachnospiraceae bacterium]
MPDSRMIHKAGKISFLLVCLFLCTACGKQKTVFEAGAEAVETVKMEETEIISKAEKEEYLDSAAETLSNLKVNINTAGTEELMTLPGIGQVRAAAIIEYREREGEFEKIEDIMNVKGIGTGIFSKINSLICVK